MSEQSSRHIDPSSSIPPSSSTSSQVARSSPSPPSASTSNYSFSNTFILRRHDYPPLLPEGPTSSDNINYDIPPPLYNNSHPGSFSTSDRVHFFSSASSSPPVPTSVILPEPSKPLYYYPPVELETSSESPTIHPASFTPRHFGVPSMRNDRYLDHRDHHYHHHRQLPQPLQIPQPPSNSSHPLFPRNSMNIDSESSTSTITPTEAELRTLQQRVRELEEELEGRSKSRDMLGIIPPDRLERTRLREQKYCSLNRAGNALCAWHDSRRERRMYAPRMAPHRTLNCGCTYEEATFEESLSRKGVGSFWPGESARMDPILRNNLLGLLRRVYRYQDGDFERNPDGTWKEGQSAAAWEEKAKRRVKRKRIIGQ